MVGVAVLQRATQEGLTDKAEFQQMNGDDTCVKAHRNPREAGSKQRDWQVERPS